jgi:hypothetical protein
MHRLAAGDHHRDAFDGHQCVVPRSGSVMSATAGVHCFVRSLNIILLVGRPAVLSRPPDDPSSAAHL